MNKQQYIDFVKECHRKELEITLAKNSDYTGDSDDPFANFRMAEVYGVCSPVVGVFLRMLDKMSRIASFLKAEGGVLAVKDEKIEDTCADLSNYSKILRGLISEKKIDDLKAKTADELAEIYRRSQVACIDEKWGTIDVCRPGRTYQVIDYDGQVIGQYAERADAEMTAMHYKGTVREV